MPKTPDDVRQIFVTSGPKLSTVCSLGTDCTGSWDGILCTGNTALDVSGADLFSSLRVHFHMAPPFGDLLRMAIRDCRFLVGFYGDFDFGTFLKAHFVTLRIR